MLRWFMVAKRLCLGVFSLFLSAVGYAAPLPHPVAWDALREPRFESVGAGIIPRDVVAALAQDKAGLLWVATGDGLVRFDGYRFRAQERDSADASRRSLGWIRVLLPARDGRLWIGTETDGLAAYDPRSERISDYGLDDKPAADAGRRPQPTIRALAEDDDGAIWVGSIGGGVARFDKASARFTHFRHTVGQAGSLPDDRVLSLLVDRAGTLWVGTWSGLSRKRRGSERFEPVASHLIGPQVQALHQASDGRIWAGTQRGTLVTLDPQTGEARVVNRNGTSDDAPGAAVSAFAEAPGGETWVGTATGIDIIDRNLRPLRQLRHDIRRPAGLAGHEVTALITDRAGWLWVGGFGLGLQRHNPNNRSIWMRGPDLEPESRLNDASVRSLLPLSNGEIWAASQRGGIAIMDDALRVVGELLPEPAPTPPRQPKPVGRAAARVTAMAQARDGSVWLGTDAFLYQFDTNRRQSRALPTEGGATRFLLAGSTGDLWLASEDGLYRLRPGANRLERVHLRDGAAPLQGAVHVLAEAPDASLWVGTVQGLFRLAAGQHALEPVVSPAGAGLANQSVAGLLFDRQGSLWVDTGTAGLHRMVRWDGRQAWFDRISERHGIVNRPFGSNLLADGRGRIWTQIQVYDPSTDRMIGLGAAEGADLGTGWFLSYGQTTDGRMLFGGSKGLLVVRPESFDASDYAPPLIATELRINGQRQSAGNLEQGLEITPEQRRFSLEFAALDYSEPRQIRYAFRLDGFDRDWSVGASNNRVASYSNLDPGRYVLRVRATNRSGVWSPHEMSIALQVQPSWWQQWWFRALVLVLLAAAMAGVVQLRTRRLRLNQLALEAKVQQRTAELQRMTGALNESSLTDPLTGLRNRRFFSMHIASDVALAMRAHENYLQHGADLASDADLIFFMFDIDHFKDINDRYGHAAGDAVLTQMRSRLTAVFRDTDYLVRWGGEEFLVVARGTSRDSAPDLAERARAAVAQTPFEIDGGLRLAKTCSVGFASFPLCRRLPQALDWDAVLNVADACLYAVKNAGRNGWLGVLDVDDDSIESIQSGARQPIARWARSGHPVMASAPGLQGWSDAADTKPSSD